MFWPFAGLVRLPVDKHRQARWRSHVGQPSWPTFGGSDTIDTTTEIVCSQYPQIDICDLREHSIRCTAVSSRRRDWCDDRASRSRELLFQVLTEREEKNSVAIASNDSFGSWTKTFTDPRLCAAIVDRLTFGGNIIETGTDSYRLAHTRATRTAT